MTSVFTTNIECPVCGADTAHTDLNIHTNEREQSARLRAETQQ
jgi:C4-type Zn-finger protein